MKDTRQLTLGDADPDQVELAGRTTTRAKLVDLYHSKKLSMGKIAEIYDCSQQTVSRAFDRHDIEKRTASERKELRKRKIRKEREYTDPEKLRALSNDEDLGISEIADEFDTSTQVIRYWMKKHDIEYSTENVRYEIPVWTLSYNGSFEGYPVMKGCDGRAVPVHSLIVIAHGADPNDVFSSNYNVDHQNRHPADNRPSNLELLSVEEHGRREWQRNKENYSGDYTRDDLESVIYAMLNPSEWIDSV